MAAKWRSSWRPARLGETLPGGLVRCRLSPRNCTLKDGQDGFCGVRGNRGGELVTMNYGKSVHITEETIETEAVNHYSPGERILSLGNIGCMLNCLYCQNWKTSQARYVADKDVHHYRPEAIVEMALQHGIRCLSWTYNDPVVWHEFVVDTARLAREAGLLNVYKSAFFITPEAIDELIPYIDVFSISVKAIDPAYYRTFTSGRMEPVLEGCKQVFRSGRHLEVSNLMITDVSDSKEAARRVADWHLRELSPRVPLHFVRFHPDYKFRNTIRTPVARLERAREAALAMGVEHVYIGNVYGTRWSNTYCRGCDAMLVSRYGLHSQILGLDSAGHCRVCGRDAHFTLLPPPPPPATISELPPEQHTIRGISWHGDIRGAHIMIANPHGEPANGYHRQRSAGTVAGPWRVHKIGPHQSFRFSLAQSAPDDQGFDVATPSGLLVHLHELFDRAHFPTVTTDEGRAETDVTPLPDYPGKQVTIRTSSDTPAADADGRALSSIPRRDNIEEK